MGNLSDVKRRLSTVKQTRQITRAMQTVSVAKMRKAEEVNHRSAAYLALITDVMRNVNARDCDFAPPAVGKDVLLVLSSDRGLCGGFDNGNLSVAQKAIDDDTLVMPIGQTAVNFFKSASNVDMRFGHLSAVGNGAAKEISDYLLKQYGNGVKSISVAYSTVDKRVVNPTVERLLPITDIKSDGNSGAEVLFEPSPEQVLRALVPLYLSGKIYGALTANFAAEQSARHQAMSAATDSADELIVQLAGEYNRERQAAVTGQIVEIVGATAALSRKGGSGEKRF
ncbi:MAG: F0F1 ATP synthase subunit gamma [Clostridiales bacterium]|nr:F0F1 ATP synthase subunit gamma [Clostridiales bacterium]